ncbi:MAG: hypothetical protein U9N84_03455 [Actinomycetota bacterium]|nr:hypothetical protein [Actinomycetota bacterium]
MTATIVLIAALVLLSAWNASVIVADTPVVVLGTDRIVLLLPQSPSVERVTSDLIGELDVLAGRESDIRVSDALQRIATDIDLLHAVAQAPVDMFDNRKAAATATPVYDVMLDPERVVVVVATVELVPGFGSTAASREHEDGHAMINLDVAERCAADALATSIDNGRQGSALIDGVITYLVDSGVPVHARYHQYVEHAQYGQHVRFAQQALDEIAGCG